MKLITTICAIALCAVALTSCKDDKKGGLRTDAMLAIRPAEGVKAEAANPDHLSALEIVKQAGEIIAPIGRRGFASDQRDLVNVKLLMYSGDVVGQFGELVTGWIESRDIVIVRSNWDLTIKDTIAYLPNAVVAKAEKDIKAAYALEDYEACYTLFDQAFRFVPITGEEWRALKAENKN